MEETKKKFTPEELAELCAKLAGDKLANDIATLRIDPEAGMSDYFVVATCDSEPQLQAVSSHVERTLRDEWALRPVSENTGVGTGGWILLDYGTVVVHLMLPEIRLRYNLEGLWRRVSDNRKNQ